LGEKRQKAAARRRGSVAGSEWHNDGAATTHFSKLKRDRRKHPTMTAVPLAAALPMWETSLTVLLSSLLITAAWLVYLYR
jgi:hypothetical protein